MNPQIINQYSDLQDPPYGFTNQNKNWKLNQDNETEITPLIEGTDFNESYLEPVYTHYNDIGDDYYDNFAYENNQLSDELKILIDTAKSLIGTPYKWGSKSLSEGGLDCSGFIQYVYKQIGIYLPPNTTGQFKAGVNIMKHDVQPGDLVCMKSKNSPSGNHIKMISKVDKNGTIYTIEAAGKDKGIIESQLTNFDNVIGFKRIIGYEKVHEYTPNKMTKKEYAKMMYNTLLYVLKEKNIPNATTWAKNLTAQTALESGWGNEWSRKNNNYAGIKGNGTITDTKEYQNGTYKTQKDSFKKYNSVESFVRDYIRILENKNIFKTNPTQFVYNLKKINYFTAPLQDYQNTFNSIYKQIKQYVE